MKMFNIFLFIKKYIYYLIINIYINYNLFLIILISKFNHFNFVRFFFY